MRMTITLSEQERLALREMAKRDMRLPRDQVRFVLRQEFERRGLLEDKQAATFNAGSNHADRR